ncbi:hypothetical protein GCM10028807_24010 [Spirosoma daeguense]
MNRLIFSIILLVSCSTYGVAQEIITQTIPSGQKQRKHSSYNLIAANHIEALANGTYTAAQSVTLQPGFLAQTGAVFSAIIRAEHPLSDEAASRLSLRAFPNPFGATTRIEYVLPYSSYAKGTLMDIQGHVILSQENAVWQEAGRHVLSVSGANLPAGTYIYQLQTGRHQQSIRLIRQP